MFAEHTKIVYIMATVKGLFQLPFKNKMYPDLKECAMHVYMKLFPENYGRTLEELRRT